jgi:methylated-DNA-[protein]-cysteine S-methyltransferase
MKFSSKLARCTWQSPLGAVTLAAHDTALVGVWFDGQQHQPAFETWTISKSHPILALACAQLGEYFDGKRKGFDLPLDTSGGTAFQQQVWAALQDIPMGSTESYGSVSQRIGRPQAVRAVGAAIGRNPLSIVIPCHRVVGGKGALTGYAGGLERKIALLRLESYF